MLKSQNTRSLIASGVFASLIVISSFTLRTDLTITEIAGAEIDPNVVAVQDQVLVDYSTPHSLRRDPTAYVLPQPTTETASQPNNIFTTTTATTPYFLSAASTQVIADTMFSTIYDDTEVSDSASYTKTTAHEDTLKKQDDDASSKDHKKGKKNSKKNHSKKNYAQYQHHAAESPKQGSKNNAPSSRNKSSRQKNKNERKNNSFKKSKNKHR